MDLKNLPYIDSRLLWSIRYNLLEIFCHEKNVCSKCKMPLIHDIDNIYKHDNCFLYKSNNCAICHEEIAISLPLSCGHLFHIQCLTTSFIDKCPLCREPIKELGILIRQPEKEVVEEIPQPRMHFNDVVQSLISIMAEGISLDNNTLAVIPHENLGPILPYIMHMILNLPGLCITNTSGREAIISHLQVNDINSINTFILLIIHHINTFDSLLRERFLRNLISYMQDLFSKFNTHVPPEMNLNSTKFQIVAGMVDEFELSPFNTIVRISDGDIEFHTHDFTLLNLKKLPKELYKDRFKAILQSRGILLNAANCTCQESYEFIMISIANDIRIIYTASISDKTTCSLLNDIIINILRHIIKFFSFNSIVHIYKNTTDDSEDSYIIRMIFRLAHELIDGKCYRIGKLSETIIEKYKDKTFLENF